MEKNEKTNYIRIITKKAYKSLISLLDMMLCGRKA